MFCIPSFDEMTNLTPYFNHVIPAYAGIQTVSHSASQVEEISETGSIRYVQAHRIGMPDSFIEHGTAADQRRQLQLDAEGIAQRVLSVFFPEAAAPSNRGGAGLGMAARA